MNDRGSITILTAGLLLAVAAMAMGAVRVAEAATLRQRAQAAADALALAESTHPLSVPELARLVDATVTRRVTGPGWVEVDVDRHGARARARASVPTVSRFGSKAASLDPRILRALSAAEVRVGRAITIVSGYRSREEQAALWARRASNPFPVAEPGSSKHEHGLAVDLSLADAALVESLGVGLCRPYPHDPVHLELCAG